MRNDIDVYGLKDEAPIVSFSSVMAGQTIAKTTEMYLEISPYQV